MFSTLSFTTPWFLAALALLPAIWLFLKLRPPQPQQRFFPAVILFSNTTPQDQPKPKRSPWWLTALRSLIFACLIVGFSGPVWKGQSVQPKDAPLLILHDNTWASAETWDEHRPVIQSWLNNNLPKDQIGALINLAQASQQPLHFIPASDLMTQLSAHASTPRSPNYKAALTHIKNSTTSFNTLWISDGLSWPNRAELLSALQDKGDVHFFEPRKPLTILRPAERSKDTSSATINLTVEQLFAKQDTGKSVTVRAIGADPSGAERELSRTKTRPFEQVDNDLSSAVASFTLPLEISNRITRFELVEPRSAAQITLTDHQLASPKVALIHEQGDAQTAKLLSPIHYITQALKPHATLIETTLEQALLESPSAIVLIDKPSLAPQIQDRLEEWVQKGGQLIRFAGPKTANFTQDNNEIDALLPVRLRFGGRDTSSALSWETPQSIQAFPSKSPFFGLNVPSDITVSRQIIAEPAPLLKERTIARLADSTPLITKRALGDGAVVFFHIAATPDWSSLPLSGLFVDMLHRLTVTHGGTQLDTKTIEKLSWVPQRIIRANGLLTQAQNKAAQPGTALTQKNHRLLPGIYRSGEHQVALNIITKNTILTPAVWPSTAIRLSSQNQPSNPLQGPVLCFAFIVFILESLFSFMLQRSNKYPQNAVLLAIGLTAFLTPFSTPNTLIAQEISATTPKADTVLAYVKTQDRSQDEVSYLGLSGLTQALFKRTTIEASPPVGVDLNQDDLSALTFLYWPVKESAPALSEQAKRALTQYLATGGVILFDTQDADISVNQTSTSTQNTLQSLSRDLLFPALKPLTERHPIAYSFYLLEQFPGRYEGGTVWVESELATQDNSTVDGVTPLIIGANDWAKAWAVDEDGQWVYPVGYGTQGQTQREFALRFGINVIMYTLSGNYKHDQRNLPKLLEKLESTHQ